MFFKFINLLNSKLVLKKIKIDLILKIKLFNDITIYEKQKYVKIIKNFTKENPRIWKDIENTIDLLEFEWFQIFIIND